VGGKNGPLLDGHVSENKNGSENQNPNDEEAIKKK
jgi:hypothetical protein